jgi:hypothetical protein
MEHETCPHPLHVSWKMSEGGLSIHRVGKELGAGRWEKGLSVEPRGLKPGNNILILSQKTCAFYVLS